MLVGCSGKGCPHVKAGGFEEGASSCGWVSAEKVSTLVTVMVVALPAPPKGLFSDEVCDIFVKTCQAQKPG